MSGPGFITFEHGATGAAAGAVLLALIAIAAVRRPAVPRTTIALVAAGALLLALAAGGLTILRSDSSRVTVLVDLSPSTRGAAYRNPAQLRERVRQLLGDVTHDVRFFAEHTGNADLSAPSLPDLPADRTVLPTDIAGTVLLFSDGRFTTPAGVPLPRIDAAIDPTLDDVNDAAVTSLDARDGVASIGVRNTASESERSLSLTGIDGGDAAVDGGAFVITRKLLPGAMPIAAAVSAGDAWPENDALRAVVSPPATAERWWVGESAGPAGWQSITPANVPSDVSAYLGTLLIVLDNVSADSLDDARRAALAQYVRDFGGGLLILGGDRAFGAGGYVGTVLDDLSPLASSPPEPTTRWVLLADASGSMNRPAGDRTRWQYAAEAVPGAAKQLPPADVLSIGSFAGDVRWWSDGANVAETLKRPLPPTDVQTRGQTNLAAALETVATTADGTLPTELLIATDAEADIPAAADLAASLKSKHVRLHVLLIGDTADAKGVAALTGIVKATGGSIRAEQLPQNWAEGLRKLLRAARSSGVEQQPTTVRFAGPLASLRAIEVAPWNQTWLKSQVTVLAESDQSGAKRAMAASWNVGEGRVIAVAFSPSQETIETFARTAERPPRNPRFRSSWDTGSMLHVTVDAADGSTYLNGESFSLDLDSSAHTPPSRHPLRQTAPGRYEVTLNAPRQPAIATLRHASRIIDARALAGRYAPEFDAIGNDRTALAALARRTGGRVIEPEDIRQIDDLPTPRRRVPLLSPLAAAGAALVAAGLIRWRIGS